MREPHEKLNRTAMQLRDAKKAVKAKKRSEENEMTEAVGYLGIFLAIVFGIVFSLFGLWSSNFAIPVLLVVLFASIIFLIPAMVEDEKTKNKAAQLEADMKRLLNRTRDQAELERTCKSCGTTWYLGTQEIQTLLNKGLLSTLVGLASSDYAQTLRNQDALGEQIQQANRCPSCRSSGFDERYVKI